MFFSQSKWTYANDVVAQPKFGFAWKSNNKFNVAIFWKKYFFSGDEIFWDDNEVNAKKNSVKILRTNE